ncbi:DUF2637 domain-containing protein [Gulosibacter molinativorax]|uniref:DUF2637 domain-containing protein n=1 Tax=Gulosibacter molinativorax TaxID=256821 RepID=A0ABT7CBL3_9MICO|nr:DUF2637 domain-containing protein [Gulosibacter molinativorax]MDJ1372591.1 DUF2637 domain-containing protein [Gulosibacter molinativorax]QUY61535.1 Xis [Gulosibacter molinativorax]
MTRPAVTARAPRDLDLSPGKQAPDARSSGGVSRFVVALAVAGTILLALGAFWLSFTTLRDLAVLSGIPAGQAWMWPLIVDGVILEATISVVALRDSARNARRFAWLLLGAGAGVSVAANITHAVVAADTRVPALIAALVASVPPLVLLAMTHLTVELTRNTTPTPTIRESARPLPLAEETTTVMEVDAPHRSEQVAALEPPETTSPTRSKPSTAVRPLTARGRNGQRGEARVRALALDAEGVSKRQIAAHLGVHPTTIGRWLNAPDRQQDGDPHD